MLDENTMKRILEMEQALVNINYMIETTNSDLNNLEGDNIVLKKGMEALKLSASAHAINVYKALAKEEDAVKKCQAGDMEKRSLQEELSTIKQKTVDFKKQQQKANKRLDQFEVLF